MSGESSVVRILMAAVNGGLVDGYRVNQEDPSEPVFVTVGGVEIDPKMTVAEIESEGMRGLRAAVTLATFAVSSRSLSLRPA